MEAPKMKRLVFPQANINLTLDELTQAVKGKIEICHEPFRQTHALRLRPKEHLLWETAKTVGYLRAPRSSRPHLSNAYFLWCEIMNRPCLSLKEWGNKTTIYLDYISTSFRATPHALEQLTQWVAPYKYKRWMSWIKPTEIQFHSLPREAATTFLTEIFPRLTDPTWCCPATDDFATRLATSRGQSTTHSHPDDPKVESIRLKAPLKTHTPQAQIPLGHFGCYICGASHELRDPTTWKRCATLLYEHVAGHPAEHDLKYETFSLNPEPYAFRILWQCHRGSVSPSEAHDTIQTLMEHTSKSILISPPTVMNEELAVSNGVKSFRARYKEWKHDMRRVDDYIQKEKYQLAEEQEHLHPPTYPAHELIGRFQRGKKPPILAEATARELTRLTDWISLPSTQFRSYADTYRGYHTVLALTFTIDADILKTADSIDARILAIEEYLERKLQSPPLRLGRFQASVASMTYFPEAFDLDRRFWRAVTITDDGALTFVTQALTKEPPQSNWYPIFDRLSNKNFSRSCHNIQGYLLSKMHPNEASYLVSKFPTCRNLQDHETL